MDNLNKILPGILEPLSEIGIKIHDWTKPLYKYTSAEIAKLILKNQKLWFRVPRYFNDPFELSLDNFEFEILYRDLRPHLEKIFVQKYPNATRKEISDFKRKHSKEEVINAYKGILEKQKDEQLIFCTSQSNKKTLMWSHYAEKHTGVCLGIIIPPVYDFKEGELSLFSLCAKYTEKITPHNYFDNVQDGKSLSIFNWLCSKSIDWSYEDEVRSVIVDANDVIRKTDNQYFDLHFDMQFIKEIYFGIRISNTDKSEIENILSEKGYNLEIKAQMGIEQGAYRLQINNL